jgi:hypothetical protein
MPENEEMPPGFNDLPPEERMFIYSNRDKPELMAVYQSTKTLQLHDKFDGFKNDCEKRFRKTDSRIISLEDSRKKARWWFSGAVTIILALKTYILVKLFGGGE